jgi:hypothetical protein
MITASESNPGEAERLLEGQPGLAGTRATFNHQLPIVPEHIR